MNAYVKLRKALRKKAQPGQEISDDNTDGSPSHKDDSSLQPSVETKDSIFGHEAKDKLEVGYFYLLDCDIKATDDMLRASYLKQSARIIDARKDAKMRADHMNRSYNQLSLNESMQEQGRS